VSDCHSVPQKCATNDCFIIVGFRVMRIFPRNNVWHVDVSIDGKRERSSTGLVVQTGNLVKDSVNKQGAERLAIQRQAELARRYSGGQKVHDWLIGKRKQLQRWKVMLKPNTTWRDITMEFLQELVKGMEKNGRIVKKSIPGQDPVYEVEPYSPSTIHSYLDEITSMVKQAAKRGECDPPEWDRKDIYNKPRTAKYKKVVHTSEELQKLFNTEIVLKNDILGEVWDTIPAWKFVICTGLRFGDVYDLTWEDIVGDEVYVKQNKTTKFIKVPINESACAILAEMKKNKPSAKEDDKVFNLPNHVTTLEHLEKWRQKAGIKSKVLWHAGRRDFATLLHKGGADIYTISGLLGHSDVRVTQRYVELTDSKKTTATDKLNGILNGLKDK